MPPAAIAACFVLSSFNAFAQTAPTQSEAQLKSDKAQLKDDKAAITTGKQNVRSDEKK